MSYVEFSLAHVLGAVALALMTLAGVAALAYAAGHSRGTAVRDETVKRNLAEKDGTIRELRQALDRSEAREEDALDRARSATAQALASTTMLRQAAADFQERADREVNKILAAADQPSEAARAKRRAAA